MDPIRDHEKTYKLPKLPIPFTRAIAADRFAGGRGIAFDTQVSVIAKPAKPTAMKNIATYRPATDMVVVPMIKPTMTLNHQELMWKKRSPVRSSQNHRG